MYSAYSLRGFYKNEIVERLEILRNQIILAFHFPDFEVDQASVR